MAASAPDGDPPEVVVEDPLADVLLAITPGDDLVHIGTQENLKSHLQVEGTDARTPEWELYDAGGRRWRIVSGEQEGSVAGFELDPDADAPTDGSRGRLTDRLDVFQARVQVALDERLTDEDYDPPFHRAPRVTGELRQVMIGLLALCPAAPAPQNPNPGSPLHNLWHFVFG